MGLQANAVAENTAENTSHVSELETLRDEHIATWLHRQFLQVAYRRPAEPRSAHTSQAVEQQRRVLTAREAQAIEILNHAIEHLMTGIPADGPDTVFEDLKRCDMQAAAILARASREFFAPTAQPSSETMLHVTLAARMRAIAAHFGLMQEAQAGR